MPAADNVLIYRLGSLGDTIVALPCFHLVRQTYPHCLVTLLTNQPVSAKASLPTSILNHSGLCDGVIGYPVGTRSISALRSIRQSIRQLRPRVVINLAAARGLFSSLRDYLFFRSCGISKILGTPFRRRDLEVLQVKEGYYEPESQRLASRLAPLGAIDLSDPLWWKLGLDQEERNQALKLLPAERKSLLAVSIGTKLPVNDWGDENWKGLLTCLSQEIPHATLILLGACDEWARSEELGRAWIGKHVNFCGRTPPRISAALLERCRLFIGQDSGPMHLASAVGIPTLGIFSWYNPPGQWFPGHPSWKTTTALYPNLPAGGWHRGLRMQNSLYSGIQLVKPGNVVRSAMDLWNSFRPQDPIDASQSVSLPTIYQA